MKTMHLAAALLILGTPACDSSQGVNSVLLPAAPSGSGEVPQAAGLTVASFSVIELQYGDSPRWEYAPQVEVAETSGAASATVTRMSFTLPGIGPLPYNTSKCVAPGQRLNLLGEVYGSFEFTVSTISASRVAPGVATVQIVYVDSTGRQSTISASGPVVPGGPPRTYSSPPLTWAC